MEESMYKIGNILIVEDNEWDTLVAVTLLKKNFNVHSVQTGQEALKAVEEFHYDIILMDIHLGNDNIDGIRVMKAIRENPQHDHLKIFALTAYSDDKSFFLEQGFDDLYVKPVIKEEMINAMSQVLRKKRNAA